MKGVLLPRNEISSEVEHEMFSLFCRQFQAIPFDRFYADLDNKNWVLLLSDDGGQLRGFTSMHLYEVDFNNTSVNVIYSGDTVIDKAAWKDSALSYYWMGAVNHLRIIHKIDELYWFLMVSGYRTYRFLPVFAKTFHPCFEQETPLIEKQLIDFLARERFGDWYDQEKGVVHLDPPPVLRDDFRGIPENRLNDPHIAHFLKCNPGNEEGHELVCLAKFTEDNLTRIGERMWKKSIKLFEHMEYEV